MPRSETSTDAEALVETPVERGCDSDLVEAEATVDRMENRHVDFRWAARDIAVLLLHALLSQSRGDEVAYRDFRDRYRATATSLGF